MQYTIKYHQTDKTNALHNQIPSKRWNQMQYTVKYQQNNKTHAIGGCWFYPLRALGGSNSEKRVCLMSCICTIDLGFCIYKLSFLCVWFVEAKRLKWQLYILFLRIFAQEKYCETTYDVSYSNGVVPADIISLLFYIWYDFQVRPTFWLSGTYYVRLKSWSRLRDASFGVLRSRRAHQEQAETIFYSNWESQKHCCVGACSSFPPSFF